MKTEFIITRTGRRFYPLEPRAEDVCIDDIAAALSKICRFNGHSRRFISVAEHSCHVAQKAIEMSPDRTVRLAALLHDAAEAYLCDLPSPIKNCVVGYREAEARVAAAIARHFGLAPSAFDYPHIKTIDQRMLATEIVQLTNHLHFDDWNWNPQEAAYPDVQIEGWVPFYAQEAFRTAFNDIDRSKDGDVIDLQLSDHITP